MLAAEAGSAVPPGMERCEVIGGGFTGAGKEFGLMRVRTPRAERSATELHAMPCSITPWGEVGIMRLPQKAEQSGVFEDISQRELRRRQEAEEEARRRQEYQEEIERRVRARLEEHERRKEVENSQNLAALFTRLGSKWGSIQEEKIEARKREIAIAHFELEKHERRRRQQAATRIQSWWRGVLERRRWRVRLAAHRKKLMEERLYRYSLKRRKLAAIDIQRIWKGWRTRLRYREIRAMLREDWLARRIRKNLHWLAMAASEKKVKVVKVKNRWIIYSTRAAVRIQAWYRGWKARQEAKRQRLLQMKLESDIVSDLERLRRIQREAVHTSIELTDHKDMTKINRALKQRDIDDHERLTADLRKVRNAARTVEADLQRDSELEIVPLRELTDFLEAKQLRADRDMVRQEADQVLQQRRAGDALKDAMAREAELQERLNAKQADIDLGRLRYEAKRIQREMAELKDGADIFSRLQDFRRDLDVGVPYGGSSA